MRGDRGRADVHGHTEGAVVEARPDADDLRLAMAGDGYLPAALAQRLLEFAQYREVAVDADELPFGGQRILQPPQVARRILHVRLLYLDKVQAHDRIQLNLACIGVLAHDLAVHLAARR